MIKLRSHFAVLGCSTPDKMYLSMNGQNMAVSILKLIVSGTNNQIKNEPDSFEWFISSWIISHRPGTDQALKQIADTSGSTFLFFVLHAILLLPDFINNCINRVNPC